MIYAKTTFYSLVRGCCGRSDLYPQGCCCGRGDFGLCDYCDFGFRDSCGGGGLCGPGGIHAAARQSMG